MSNTCHAEREYPQDGGHRKQVDDLYLAALFGALLFMGHMILVLIDLLSV